MLAHPRSAATAAFAAAIGLAWSWVSAQDTAAPARSVGGVRLPSPSVPLPRADGYFGVWYANQPSGDEYAYKYSGGLGTYCAKHQPFAVHRPEVGKTFFVYGGAPRDDPRRLLHMVAWFDHETRRVPRPAVLLDKRTGDAHDNPVLAVDDDGHLWIFSTSHGRGRPSFVHRSAVPYAIDRFETVDATYVGDDGRLRPLDNFSYMQAWHVPGYGFACLFTRYGDLAKRTNMFMSSPDGVAWSRWQRLAGIGEGHYQISQTWRGDGRSAPKVAAVSNHHPEGRGLNWRTNLYYMQAQLDADDPLPTWTDVRGEVLDLPLTQPDNPALVHDYAAEGRLVYLKDLAFDDDGDPVVLYVTSAGYEAGPENGPRTWTTAEWTGPEGGWRLREVTTSDNNYDMGSLWIDGDTWRLVAPTDPGPQAFNPGGEVVVWESRDRGARWQRLATLTADSPHNHTYVRRPVDAHPSFFALWADGHGRRPSSSRLWFADRDGNTYRLPDRFSDGDATALPERIGR